MRLHFGSEAILSYKRLNYTVWHAFAEFVDNSTQSYSSNRSTCDAVLSAENERFTVSIVYEKAKKGSGLIRITDNAAGMSMDELDRAMQVGIPPSDTSGRSRYGMGMKTAACWLGNYWTVRTKRIGDTTEQFVEVDVERVASGDADLRFHDTSGKRADLGYTIIEIGRLNQELHARTQGKVRQFLASMYRQDFRNGILVLEWQNKALAWTEIDPRLLLAANQKPFKKSFEFSVHGKKVHGWVGILGRGSGSRSDAGFAILYRDRVLQGWPDAWRPESLYGQYLGSNDLVNQRLVGEIHLDAFEVSHTKDRMVWLGDELDKVERGLLVHCGDYRDEANIPFKTRDGRGPSETETATAVDELKHELESPEVVDLITLSDIPAPELVNEAEASITEQVTKGPERFRAKLGKSLEILVFLEALSANDPYVIYQLPDESELIVIVNDAHPHWSQLRGAEGVLNYLRHCVYDAVAEWKAHRQNALVVPQTIKMIKDGLLRAPLIVEVREQEQRLRDRGRL